MSSTKNNKELVRATGLNRVYGNHHAVINVDLVLRKGEVLGLLGPNGAGKSTTMQMLTGNISPTSGEIKINGVDLLDNPQQAKASIGYLPEQPPVYRDMTAMEFLSYCAALRDIPKSSRKQAIQTALQRCSLEDVANKLTGNLSKGFQQRVGIAQAILHNPEVIILDEPTVGLDPIQINEIRDLIRELGNDHSVILSTHILPEVQAVCDRVQIINQGETVFSDTFDKLSKRQSVPALIVDFTGDIKVDTKNEVKPDSNKVSSLEILQNLTGIESVEAIETSGANQRFKLKFKDKLNASAVADLASKQGWQLNELTPQSETLEQIFMNLIHGEKSIDTKQQSKQQAVSNKEAAE